MNVFDIKFEEMLLIKTSLCNELEDLKKVVELSEKRLNYDISEESRHNDLFVIDVLKNKITRITELLKKLEVIYE